MVNFVYENETIVSLSDFNLDHSSSVTYISFLVDFRDYNFSAKRKIDVPIDLIEHLVSSLHLYIRKEIERVKFNDYDLLFSIEINRKEIGEEIIFRFRSDMGNPRTTELRIQYISQLFRLEDAYDNLVSELSLIGILL